MGLMATKTQIKMEYAISTSFDRVAHIHPATRTAAAKAAETQGAPLGKSTRGGAEMKFFSVNPLPSNPR